MCFGSVKLEIYYYCVNLHRFLRFLLVLQHYRNDTRPSRYHNGHLMSVMPSSQHRQNGQSCAFQDKTQICINPHSFKCALRQGRSRHCGGPEAAGHSLLPRAFDGARTSTSALEKANPLRNSPGWRHIIFKRCYIICMHMYGTKHPDIYHICHILLRYLKIMGFSIYFVPF